MGRVECSAVYFGANRPWQAVPTDGLWIILLGMKGYVGLTLFYVAMILPAALFILRFPPRLWGIPQMAAGSLAAALLTLYMVDCLMNGFPKHHLRDARRRAHQPGAETLPNDVRGATGSPLADGRRRHPRVAAFGDRGEPARGQPDVMADRYRSLGRSFKQEGRRTRRRPPGDKPSAR